MREITLEEIQKKFEGLPEDLKWAIMAAKVDDNIIEIGKEHSLNVEMMGQLSLETHMVMFGFTPPDKFEESVKKSLGLPDEKTHAVVDAVNEKILKEIRKKMMGQSGVEMAETSPHQDSSEPRPEAPASVSNGEKQILDSAGIQIVSEPASDESEKKFEGDVHEILAKKLSGPVQAPIVKTEHSPDSIGKPNIPTPASVKPKIPDITVDPYRELPE